MRLNTETRQEQIKEAVLNIISEEGMASLSTKRIAKKIGISEGTIYRHFDSKKDILLSIVEDVFENLVTNQKRIAKMALPAEEKLFAFLCNQVKYLIEKKAITILLFSEATHSNDSELKEKLFLILKAQKKVLKKIVQEGIDEGLWDENLDIDAFASLYIGIPITLNIEMILNKDNFETENFCQKKMALLKRILEK